ncbi:MAG: PASTA domain-containing protein, partial [Nocardioides sp.]
MPDLIGLPAVEAATRIGTVAASSDWGRPMTVRCEQRPGTVAWQRPAPGTPVSDDVVVEVRTAALDLEEFRGPCDPAEGDLGPVTGTDAALAREFYRFAADPSLGAPFVSG